VITLAAFHQNITGGFVENRLPHFLPLFSRFHWHHFPNIRDTVHMLSMCHVVSESHLAIPGRHVQQQIAEVRTALVALEEQLQHILLVLRRSKLDELTHAIHQHFEPLN
jgi:hypothetical protein